ncbi:hypothetical protein BT96DRAFT_1010221 [Gymnopus androsaceus JB14]|uniref:Uncharacterized protein n=1 Tax=Gymnopus androsaceus JB14 TaxID=1447944 RepID=A0A6A4GB22_9AGAR|nr:hypothetical protein BT96DRAFT_1010221 [Gymnopus androsaceus JB14]
MRVSLLVASFWSSTQAVSVEFDSACDSIASKAASIANRTIFFSELIHAGTNLTFPDQDPNAIWSPRFRLLLWIFVELRSMFPLPTDLESLWRHGFLEIEPEGFRVQATVLDGCIQYADLAYTTALDFATVGANNGHSGTTGEQFYGDPD